MLVAFRPGLDVEEAEDVVLAEEPLQFCRGIHTSTPTFESGDGVIFTVTRQKAGSPLIGAG